MIIYGINTVLEALRAGRLRELRVAENATGGRIRDVLTRGEERGVRVRRVPLETLDHDAGGGVHQGVVAVVEEGSHFTVEELVRGARTVPLLLVLDGIQDPQNLGAILRTADAAGSDGVIVQSRRSAALGGAAAKASAGAIAHVRIAEVVNIARALEELKQLNVWTIGLAGDAEQRYDAVDFTLPTAIVLGAEGEGLRRLVRERCDMLASIPLYGRVDSLNVSVAGGITLFEALRQRSVSARIRPGRSK